MPLVMKARDDRRALTGSDSATSAFEQRANGCHSSLATLTWPAGFRSTAAVSSAEQILHITSGSIDAFAISQDGARHAGTISDGGFLRIPALAVHWFCNTSTRPAGVIRFCTPVICDGSSGASGDLFAEWEADAPLTTGWLFDVDPRRYKTAALEAELARNESALCELTKACEEVGEYSIERGFAVDLRTKMVFGARGSVMVATRPAGYHSTPHVHDAEQLNVVTKGEIWGYIISPDGAGHSYHLHEGDLWRVPALAVHWAWNRADETVTLVEYHTPGLQRDPVVGKSAVSLLNDTELRESTSLPVSNLFVTTTPEVVHDAENRDPDDAG